MPALFFFIWPLGQAAKTSPSHGEIGSSILPGVTIMFLNSSVVTHIALGEQSELSDIAFRPNNGWQNKSYRNFA